MKKALSIVLMIIWCGVPVAAQSALSTQYPAGLPLSRSSGPSLGLAGSGTGVLNDFYGMADNPGNLGGISRAVFSSYMSFDYLSINDNGRSSGNLAFSPQLLSFAFPLGSLGTFGFSLDRRTNMNYKFRSKGTVGFPETGYDMVDTIDLGLVKSGSVTAWQAGWGYAFGQFLRAGICYERIYLYGSDITRMSTSSNMVEGSVATAIDDTTEVIFRGNGIRVGALFPLKKLTIGCSGEYVFRGDLEQVTQGAHFASAETEKASFRLPPSLSAGASYRISSQWLAAANLGMTLWQHYESSIDLGMPVDNALSFALGGQYIPAPNLLVPRYWEIVQYRVGCRYTQLPVRTASEMGITLSFGLPVQQGGGLFDLVFELGRRTDGSVKNYSENFFKVGFGINGGRKWFQSTGIRY